MAAVLSSAAAPNLFADLPLAEFLPPKRDFSNTTLYSLRRAGDTTSCLGEASFGQLVADDAACAARWAYEGGRFVLVSDDRLCLDLFAAQDALGLYACHTGDNQRFLNPGGGEKQHDLFCAGASGGRPPQQHCVVRQLVGEQDRAQRTEL